MTTTRVVLVANQNSKETMKDGHSVVRNNKVRDGMQDMMEMRHQQNRKIISVISLATGFAHSAVMIISHSEPSARDVMHQKVILKLFLENVVRVVVVVDLEVVVVDLEMVVEEMQEEVVVEMLEEVVVVVEVRENHLADSKINPLAIQNRQIRK